MIQIVESSQYIYINIYLSILKEKSSIQSRIQFFIDRILTSSNSGSGSNQNTLIRIRIFATHDVTLKKWGLWFFGLVYYRNCSTLPLLMEGGGGNFIHPIFIYENNRKSRFFWAFFAWQNIAKFRNLQGVSKGLVFPRPYP